MRETVNEKAIGLFDFTPCPCFDASLCSKAPRWAHLLLFCQAIKLLGNKSNHFFLPWIRSQRIQNSTGQMLNQDISTFLNTLLIAKAKWVVRALIPEPFSAGIFSHWLSPPSATSSCALATTVRMFQSFLTLTHPSASNLLFLSWVPGWSLSVISKLSASTSSHLPIALLQLAFPIHHSTVAWGLTFLHGWCLRSWAVPIPNCYLWLFSTISLRRQLEEGNIYFGSVRTRSISMGKACPSRTYFLHWSHTS